MALKIKRGTVVPTLEDGEPFIQETSGSEYLWVGTAQGNKRYKKSISKRYVALLTQTGTDDPVATVLENELSAAIVWARSTDGTYTGTLADAFTTAKTVAMIGMGIPVAGERGFCQIAHTSEDVVTITTADEADDSIALDDEVLSGTPVIIEVFD